MLLVSSSQVDPCINKICLIIIFHEIISKRHFKFGTLLVETTNTFTGILKAQQLNNIHFHIYFIRSVNQELVAPNNFNSLTKCKIHDDNFLYSLDPSPNLIAQISTLTISMSTSEKQLHEQVFSETLKVFCGSPSRKLTYWVHKIIYSSSNFCCSLTTTLGNFIGTQHIPLGKDMFSL